MLFRLNVFLLGIIVAKTTNTSSTPYDMALWEVSGGIKYTFPDFDPSDPQASFFRNKERLLISSVSPEELRAAYDIPDDVRMLMAINRHDTEVHCFRVPGPRKSWISKVFHLSPKTSRRRSS